MQSLTIRAGDLVVELDPEGDVQIVRQSTGQAIRLSRTEWEFLVCLEQLFGRGVVPPTNALTTLG